LAGCGDKEGGDQLGGDQDGAPGQNCEEELPAAEVVLTWVLTIDAQGEQPALTATAGSASGLELNWIYGTPLGGDARAGRIPLGQIPGDVTPLRLSGGSTDTERGWSAWAEAIESFDEACETDDVCAKLWRGGSLSRNGSLSLETEGGEVLASWRLSGVWPSALVTAGTGEGSIPELALVATVEEFSFRADSSRVLALFGTAPMSAPVPIAPESEDDEAWAAYGQAVQEFAAGYHAPRAAIDRLNDLAMLRQTNESDLEFLHRVADAPARFRVTIDGYEIAQFSELQGITTKVEVIDSFDSQLDRNTLRRPGGTKYGDIVLKRGVATDLSFYEWYTSGLAGPKALKSITVCLPPDGTTGTGCEAAAEIHRWNFTNGWPAKYDAAPLGSQANSLAIETVTITHEGVGRL
jgi:phage tail-like protein